MPPPQVSFRDGTSRDLRSAYALSQIAIYGAAVQRGVLPPDSPPSEPQIEANWRRQRALIEFLGAQPDGSFTLAEDDGELVGYARVVRFEGFEQLTELMVAPGHQGQGIGRALLELAFPHAPSAELARVVVATGQPNDLGLYMGFGVMPVAGHWQMRCRTGAYLERRSQELDRPRSQAVVLKPDRALAEWLRLEPEVIGYERRALHEFFARERTCLAIFDEDAGRARALCWVSAEGEIGPAVALDPRALVPIVLAALDRVAATQEPEYMSVFATTVSWLLLRRLRVLGFGIHWPSWIMGSRPLPGLDRYVPTRPPHVL